MESGMKRVQDREDPEAIISVYVDYESEMVRVNTKKFFGLPVEIVGGQPVVRLEVFKKKFKILEK